MWKSWVVRGVCLTRYCRAALSYTPTSHVWVTGFCYILSNLWCWVLRLNKNFSRSHVWMASRAQWAWIWGNSRRQWGTGKPGSLRPMLSFRVGRDLAAEHNHKCVCSGTITAVILICISLVTNVVERLFLRLFIHVLLWSREPFPDPFSWLYRFFPLKFPWWYKGEGHPRRGLSQRQEAVLTTRVCLALPCTTVL